MKIVHEDGIPVSIDWQLQGPLNVGDRLVWKPLSSVVRVKIVAVCPDDPPEFKVLDTSGCPYFFSEETIRRDCVQDYSKGRVW